jgi:hypothetical protein
VITKWERSQKHKNSGEIKWEDEAAFKRVLDFLAGLVPEEREKHRLWKYLNRKKFEAILFNYKEL